jgi:GT2 family glycosyltransferase
MDHISIIIVHYNTEDETRECLESLTKITTEGFRHNIIVVDNASKKPLVLPKHLHSQKVEVLRSEANLGFTGGNNLGVRFAIEKYNSDYILMLNSDTLVDPHFLTKLYTFALSYQKAGLFCSKIYFAKGCEFHKESYQPDELGKVLWYAGGSIDWRNLYCFHRGVDEVDRGQFDHQLESDFATGCCVLISREVLETVGMLDKNFFLYLEDVDLSVRAKKRGYVIGFCSDSVIWHKNAGSSGGSGSLVQQYYQNRNRILFTFKHGALRAKITAAKLAIKLFTQGSAIERRAMTDLLLHRLGKQPVL